MNKLTKIAITTLGILTLWSGIYFIAIPQFLNSDFMRTKIETEITQKTGLIPTIDSYKIKTCLSPELRFKAQNITLNGSTPEEQVTITNISTKFNWLTLLTGKFSFRKFEADEINISLTKDYTERFITPRIFNIIKHTRIKNAKIHNLSLNLKNQKLINDISFTTNNFYIEKYDPNNAIKLNSKILFQEANNSGDIKLVADIKLPYSAQNLKHSIILADINSLNLQTFSKAINKLNPQFEDIKGIINLNIDKDLNDFFTLNLFSNSLYLKTANNYSPISHSSPTEIKTLLTVEKDKITINSLKIISNLLKASIFGIIDIKEIKNPELNLSISMDKSNVSEIIKLIPAHEKLIPELDIHALKKYPIDGNALAHLEINGKFLRPQINGNILITDAYIIHPIKNTKKATIKLTFNREKMMLETTVPTAPKERVQANGTFDLYDEKRCSLNVKSTSNVNLETAQTILNPLQEIIKINFGPVPIMKLMGHGNIDIKINGNVQDPHITGLLNFKNAQVSFIDMPNLSIKNANGDLTFSDTDTYFKTSSATLNSKPINIEGTCTLQGNFDFKATTKGQNLTKLFNDIRDNNLLSDLNSYIQQIEKVNGLGDIDLNIYGAMKNIHEMEFNKNIFTKGQISLNAVNLKLKSIPQTITNIFGELAINNKDLAMNLYALLNKSKITIDGKIKDSTSNILIKTKNFRIIDGIATLPINTQRNILTLIKSNEFINLIPTINTNFTARYKGAIEKIEPEKLEVYGNLYSSNPNFKKINFEHTNSILKFSPIKIKTKDIDLETVGTATNIFTNSPIISGNFILKNFNLNLINISTLKNFNQLKQLCSTLENLTGRTNVNINIQNNNVNANCELKNIKITENNNIHEILSGNIQVKNSALYANNINARLYNMPTILNGKISFINKELPTYDLQINAKPNQEIINTCFNQKAIYPIKVKGDLTLNADITGNRQLTQIKSNLLLDKESSIYYMGATLGDKTDAVKLTSNLTLRDNQIKINNFNYDKIVLALDKNKTTVPLLNINGTMSYTKDNTIGFNNLKIKSKTPVDARIFNIIFRKPFMKEGVFTSDLNLNGSSLNPYILGKLNITGVNIPLVETNINNINVDFTPKLINIISNGDLVTNQIRLNATLKNDLNLPLQVENMNIHVAKLDTNKITQKIKHIEENNFKIHSTTSVIQPLDYTNVILKNATISADTILIDDITATNYISNLEINKDKILKVKTFNFDLAEGTVNGSMTHNYNNNHVKIDLNLNQANASQMAETLFNIKGQIQGLANGKMELSCDAQNEKTCFATLSGSGNFEIQNGKMPKLGSLEYLLKASNLVNNGFAGLTINGLIDLLSPLKSGEFKTIYGNFTLENGIANKINIYSHGKDLNLYITGNYNLSNAIADFKIFGSLSKNATTLFNKVKNLSLNTLLKTIPGIKKETPQQFNTDIAKIPNSNDINNIYKFFRVIIQGDINGEDFVKSFEWIE